MDDIIFGVLKNEPPYFPPEDWAAWITQHNSNQDRHTPMSTIGRLYTYERVDIWISLANYRILDCFPGFMDYVHSLPITLEKIMFIRQIPGRDIHWHHDFDKGGLGLRICLAGQDDGTLEILPTNQRIDPRISAGRPPFINTPFGLIHELALSKVDPSQIVSPRGVKTGKTWVISSERALHRVKSTEHLRIQCILYGRVDRALLELDPSTVIMAKGAEAPSVSLVSG
jgi:hypothetical protein